jgi:hypothetical protein
MGSAPACTVQYSAVLKLLGSIKLTLQHSTNTYSTYSTGQALSRYTESLFAVTVGYMVQCIEFNLLGHAMSLGRPSSILGRLFPSRKSGNFLHWLSDAWSWSTGHVGGILRIEYCKSDGANETTNTRPCHLICRITVHHLLPTLRYRHYTTYTTLPTLRCLHYATYTNYNYLPTYLPTYLR